MLLALAGCGGKSAAEKRACERAAEQTAAAKIARNAYDAGRLGGPAQFRPYFGANDRYLDGDGHLLPYDELKPHAKVGFGRWMAHVESSTKPPAGPIGDEMYAARIALRDKGAPGCG